MTERPPGFRFSRMELSGALGDLGTLLPISIALITVIGLGFTPVFLMVGIAYMATGLLFRIAVPVQPMKAIAAIALASPALVTPPALAAAALILGAFLLLLAVTGLAEALGRLFTKPLVRGLQLGLGLILLTKGVGLVAGQSLFPGSDETGPGVFGLPINPIVGVGAAVLALVLLKNRRFPAALVLVAGGALLGALLGAFHEAGFRAGPTAIEFSLPPLDLFASALVLLVIPQIPLTIGNAIVGATDAARNLYDDRERTRHVTNRNLSLSMGAANLATGFVGGMPLCHGAGGFAAHYRFGARTGGAGVMIGAFFLVLAIALGRTGTTILSAIPNGVLGVMLAFAGLELAMLVRDVREKRDLFVTLLIAGVGLATLNLAIALGAGIAVEVLTRWLKIEI